MTACDSLPDYEQTSKLFFLYPVPLVKKKKKERKEERERNREKKKELETLLPSIWNVIMILREKIRIFVIVLDYKTF